MLYEHPVVDEPWSDFIAPDVVTLKVDVHQLEVCEWEERAWEDIKSGGNERRHLQRGAVGN